MITMTDDQLIDELKKRFQEKQQSLSELKKLSTELKIVNRKLSESESMKSNFLANIRNEIINPFASIIGLSKHIINVKKEDWKKVITMVSLIHSEAFELNFQLKNIFTAAEFEAGESRPQFAKTDIVSIIKEIIENFSQILRAKKLTLAFDNDLTKSPNEQFLFVTDPTKFEVILSNLLKNAVEFSFENNEIRIHAWFDHDTNALNVSVKDNGIGIPPNEAGKIFDRFSRLNRTISSKSKGHGLGLSVTRSLLDMLNGAIELESEPGIGSLFTVHSGK